MATNAATNKFSPGRVVQMVLERAVNFRTRWAAVESIAAETGCAAQTPPWPRSTRTNKPPANSARFNRTAPIA